MINLKHLNFVPIHGIMRRVLPVMWVICFALVTGCQSDASSGANAAGDQRLRVSATTGFVQEVVARVAGDAVVLHRLMGPGIDPHQFKPSARDVAALRGARVIFYNGAHLEGKLQDILERVALGNTQTVPLVSAIPVDRLKSPQGFEGQFDPHIWFDPELWAMTPAVVADVLSELVPEHAATFRENARQFAEEIRLAGQEARRRLQAVPPERRVLVTSHDAFHYFGRAFSFEVAAPQGISTLAEAGIADVAALSQWIRQRQIPAIFVESSVSPAIISRIAQDSGARVGGELFSDAMGAPGELREVDGEVFDTGTYTGMLLYNASTIASALRP